MGTHGLLHREGGEEYVKFIVRQCNLPAYDPPSKVPPVVTNEQLRLMCSDILLLLTTTVTDAEKVMISTKTLYCISGLSDCCAYHYAHFKLVHLSFFYLN